jgi:putative oxidoreductase
MKKISFTDFISILLVLLFVYTATSKILDYDRFVFQMKHTPAPLMHFAAGTLGWIIPAIEIGLVLVLLLGIFRPDIQSMALFCSLLLLTAFEIYIALMLGSGLNLPCSCGGIVSAMSWKQHLFFNAFVIGLISLAINLKNKSKGAESIRLRS